MAFHRSIQWFLGAMIASIITGCEHEVDGAAADAALFKEATADGYTYYVGTPGVTPPAGDSPHGDMRVRFNSVAQAALDSATQELLTGGSFPTGSVIVKDVYAGSSIDQYAVMKKDPSAPLAGSGWLWAEYSPDGSVDYSAGLMGSGCISCHAGSTNRDLVRIFDLH